MSADNNMNSSMESNMSDMDMSQAEIVIVSISFFIVIFVKF